jgi:hypothetical protein
MERKFPKLEPLPKEETPAPLIIPKREKPVEKPEETTEKPEETPADETSAEKITEPVAETSPAEEKASAEARAEALIMSHTAKIKPNTKSKAPLTIIGILAGLAIAVGILFASGVIKLEFPNNPSSDNPKTPLPALAGKLCEESHDNHNWDFLFKDENGDEDKDAAPYIGGEEIKEYVLNQKACTIDYTKEESDAPNFEFIYIVLGDDYENIGALKEVLTTLAEYQDVKKNTDKYFLSVAKSTSPYIYLAAYGRAVVETYADDEETAETILKELNFPDYK